MGGIEGSRGYVYQGLAAVIKSLTDSDWDRISIEYPTIGDKVDIALLSKGKVKMAIQVKSTDNSFAPGDLKKWITELYKDCNSPTYELTIIGNCPKAAKTFINSIKKYKSGQCDKEAMDSLAGFDTTLLDNADICVHVLPNDQEYLQAIMRDSLSHYMSSVGLNLLYDQTHFIAMNLLADELLKSTQGGSTSREELNECILSRFRMLAGEFTNDRTALCILSFSRGAGKAIVHSAKMLDLRDRFNGRHIKPEYDWNKDILPSVRAFIEQNTNQEVSYELHLETHSSIAFLIGQILDTKSGVDIFPIQKTAKGYELWQMNSCQIISYPELIVDNSIYSSELSDTALIINFSQEIKADVEQYINGVSLPIGRIISCSVEKTIATSFSIQNGTHAMALVGSICSALKARSANQKQARLHIFSAAPNAFMFFLGRASRGFGKCTLYEYDFEQEANCSYTPSISLN
ncbi:MAG: SAVED domain-containing protein [Oscillospiraceae bacterium]|nr:SAVED domain-containing protein [Oscillospiraceae bacterium]